MVELAGHSDACSLKATKEDNMAIIRSRENFKKRMFFVAVFL
jgi:hypothetical protein